MFVFLYDPYIMKPESEFSKKLRTVTKATDMIQKDHAFKTPVIKSLGNLDVNGTLTGIEKSHALPETEKYKIIYENDLQNR